LSQKSSDAKKIVDYTPKAKTQPTEAYSIKLNHNSKIDFSNVDLTKDQTGRRETNEKQNLDKNSPTPQPKDPQIENPRIDAATPSNPQPVPLEAYPKKKEPVQLPSPHPTIFSTYQKGFLGHKDIKIYNSFQKIKRNQSRNSISLTNDQVSPASVIGPKEISPKKNKNFTLIAKRDSFGENLEKADKKEESFLNRKNKHFFEELNGDKMPTKNDLLLDSYKNKYLPSTGKNGAKEFEDAQSGSVGLGLGGPKRESEVGFMGRKMGVEDLEKLDKVEIGGRGRFERVDKECIDYFDGGQKGGRGEGGKLDDKGRMSTPGFSGVGNQNIMALGNDR
jgi:hypothetical protein